MLGLLELSISKTFRGSRDRCVHSRNGKGYAEVSSTGCHNSKLPSMATTCPRLGCSGRLWRWDRLLRALGRNWRKGRQSQPDARRICQRSNIRSAVGTFGLLHCTFRVSCRIQHGRTVSRCRILWHLVRRASIGCDHVADYCQSQRNDSTGSPRYSEQCTKLMCVENPDN